MTENTSPIPDADTTTPIFTGLVLAGGEGSRMGGNKPFRMLGQRRLIDHAITNARHDCSHILIASNEDPQKYAAHNCPVIADCPQPGLGPMAGILAGLNSLPANSDWLAVYAVDCPFLPSGLPGLLFAAITQVSENGQTAQHAAPQRTLAAHARYQGRDHYLASLWHRDMAPVISALLAQDQRRVRLALDGGNAKIVEIAAPQNPALAELLFANINRPEDLARLEHAAKDMGE
ncbi:molybdenum cofactor guanylyltransferase [Thalassospira marina]|uniref:Molybdenum cofactor guanylyltransferase n=1 Tax=Thalassospira marina TaxID=2048283 RepID=A0A2N3KCY2_9PROT|nr:molybdenum cofactor guanylyltransferase [Thalassospira marina]PKR48422.1 molybdenum cofactor guanylyltransferase [Thalassospira marina]